MKKYIDGFVIPIHPDKLEDYRRLAETSARIWKEHGALEYIEAVADDLTSCTPEAKPATEKIGALPGETLVFSYIVYESREHRDAVNAKVFADPRLKDVCPEVNNVFDVERMIHGGFRSIVEA